MTVGDALGQFLPKPEAGTVGEAFGDTFVEPERRDQFTVGGRETGVDIPDAARPIMNFAEAFNQQLAKFLSAPIELIEEGFRAVGVDPLKEPGDATRATIDAFESVGISATPMEGLSEELGKNAFSGMLSLAALTAAAPAAVARTAVSDPSTTQRVVNDLGRFFIKRPGIAATTEAGAVTGQTIGGREFGPAGEISGAVIGGMSAATVGPALRFGVKNLPVVAAATIGGAVGAPAGLPGVIGGSGLAGVAAKKVTGSVVRSAQRLLGRVPPLEPEPLLVPPREGAATSAAAQAVESGLATSEREITSILSKLPQQTAEEASVALRAGLDRALRIARTQESAGFTDEFLAERTAADELVAAAQEMLATLKPKSPGTPTEQIRRVINEFTQKTSAEAQKRLQVLRESVGGQAGQENLVAKEVTAGEIQAFRADLLDAARSNGAGPNPSRRMVRNLNILADAALDSMKAVDEEVIDAARATSRRLNELFFRGPVGRVMRRTTAGESAVEEEAAAQTLLRRPAGFRQIGPIAKEFGSQEVEGLTRDSIRALFRVAAEQGGQSAQLWLRRNASAVDSFADEAIKLQGIADNLAAAHATKAATEKGALARFASQDPEIGIRRVFSSANPAQTAREIITKINSDPEAVSGFRSEILAELFRLNGFSAVKLKADLDAGKTRRLIEAALPDDMFARLKNIVNTAAKVETGTARVPGVAVPILGPILGLTARFIGAGLGRRVAAIGGGQATIQQTGAAATFSKTFMERITGKINPAEAFARAVSDPEFERLMLTAMPVTAKEVTALSRSLRALISAEAAARAAATGRDNRRDQ